MRSCQDLEIRYVGPGVKGCKGFGSGSAEGLPGNVGQLAKSPFVPHR
jgi:hypothetical protein